MKIDDFMEKWVTHRFPNTVSEEIRQDLLTLDIESPSKEAIPTAERVEKPKTKAKSASGVRRGMTSTKDLKG
jgi:hypothetical protein